MARFVGDAFKADASADDAVVQKEIAATISVESGEARTAKFVFSNGSVDRYGDTIEPQGWELENYMVNPVVLDSHDSSSIEKIMGKTLSLAIEDNQLVGTIEFVPGGKNAVADLAFWLAQNGFLSTVSVGFRPIEYRASSDKKRKGGVDFLRQELLEVSLVPVPALPSALIQAKKMGLTVPQQFRSVLEQYGRQPVAKLKGMWQVSWLANLIGELGWLQDQCAGEAQSEGDASPVPANLLAALKQLGEVLLAMTQEELSELYAAAENEAPGDDETGEMLYLSAPESNLAAAMKFVLAAKQDAGAFSALRNAFSAHKRGAKVTFRIDKGEAMPLARAGRVLSAANEKSLAAAHDMITNGCDQIKAILDSVAAVEEPAEQPVTVENVTCSAEKEARLRKAKALKAMAEVCLVS